MVMVAIGMADQGSSDLNKQKKMKVKLEDGGGKGSLGMVFLWEEIFARSVLLRRGR